MKAPRKSYFRILKQAAESYTGAHWFASSLAVAALVLWPVIVFWQDISFEPSRFVEEWVKTTTGGLVLLFAFEIAKLHAEEHNAAARSRDSLNLYFVPHLEKMKEMLSAMLLARRATDLSKMKNAAARGAKHLSQLMSNIGLSAVFFSRPDIATFLTSAREGEVLKRCDAIFRQCRISVRAEDLTPRELEECQLQVSGLLNDLLDVAGRVS